MGDLAERVQTDKDDLEDACPSRYVMQRRACGGWEEGRNLGLSWQTCQLQDATERQRGFSLRKLDFTRWAG